MTRVTRLGPHRRPAATDALGPELPTLVDSVRHITELGKPTVRQVLAGARDAGRVATQPRCGVGGHVEMLDLLRTLESEARPDILTVTIDAHTRLKRFGNALRALNLNPADLNGYPLVTHGWRRGRELDAAVEAPIEVRHGSPDPRTLFAVSLAAGFTSFEGGGISYNLPYAKDVPLAESLAAWREVDTMVGGLARLGLIIDRELFGTLTAVLVPPSLSLAVSVLEAVAATDRGVRCLSIAYPQGGDLVQDIAALRAIPVLAARYLPAGVEVFPVLHEFMGVFPSGRRHAEELIFYGALTANLGGATKVVTKTYQEALGVPDVTANVAGLRLASLANSRLLRSVSADETRIAEELSETLTEVAELVEPVLSEPVLAPAVVGAFADGRLDVPFSASRHARAEVIPRRDVSGAIRYHSPGRLPLSRRTRQRHARLLALPPTATMSQLTAGLTDDINYFRRFFLEDT
jgi:methylaspartate mutase epsilon subunit